MSPGPGEGWRSQHHSCLRPAQRGDAGGFPQPGGLRRGQEKGGGTGCGGPPGTPPPRPIKGPKWHLASRRGFPMVGGSVRSPSLRGCWHPPSAGAGTGPSPGGPRGVPFLLQPGKERRGKPGGLRGQHLQGLGGFWGVDVVVLGFSSPPSKKPPFSMLNPSGFDARGGDPSGAERPAVGWQWDMGVTVTPLGGTWG